MAFWKLDRVGDVNNYLITVLQITVLYLSLQENISTDVKNVRITGNK